MSTKKDEIIALALRLIKKRGFLSISYDDIAKELNMTKTAVHYHYKNKEDLGIAICERIQASQESNYKKCLDEIKNHKGHPWTFIENKINFIKENEICPVSSFQSDYEGLPSSIKEKLKEISSSEFKLMELLINAYNPNLEDKATGVRAIMEVKGALQYRRILGESFYNETLKIIKDQFYSSLK